MNPARVPTWNSRGLRVRAAAAPASGAARTCGASQAVRTNAPYAALPVRSRASSTTAMPIPSEANRAASAAPRYRPNPPIPNPPPGV